MLLRRAGLAVAGAWIAYAWGAHLLAPAYAWRGSRRRRRLALTFDDGPDPVWTPRVLDLLAARGVRGTFFLVGTRAARAPETVRRIAAEGHEVASHAWSHRSLWLLGPRATESEIGRAHALLADLAGREPRHFRPPWGMVNAALFAALRRHRERLVLWSVQPEGLRPAPAARQTRHVLARAHPGAIVDLHDAEGTPGAPARLVEALPAMIDGLRGVGYELTTVADVLDGDAQRSAPAPLSAGSLT
jgi:peptidoglycan/xylan/chitin deacetylase (PgdA/CDA1 family)